MPLAIKVTNAIAVVCISFISTMTAFADWSQFRGPGGEGLSTETNLPATFGENENLLWKTAMPGAGAASPIILGTKIYTTCYSGYWVDKNMPGNIQDLKLHILCISSEDGKIVWDTTVTPKLPEKEKVRDHGYAGPTPATDGKALYVFFGKTGLFKFDLNGKQIWQADAGAGTHGWGSGTSPVLYSDVVIVNASVESQSLIGFSKTTGKELWRQRGMKASWNTPHLVNVGKKSELVVSVKDKILAFDPATGTPLWNCEGIHDYVCPSIVSKDGVVYAIGGRKSQAIAVKAGGRGDVTASHRLWVADVGANVSSPVVYKDHLYWTSDRNRTAYCLRLSDGKIVYAEKSPVQPYASTVIADGKQYVVGRFKGTIVLEAKPEFKLLAQNKFDDRSVFNASPAVADGKIYLRSDTFLYCIGRK